MAGNLITLPLRVSLRSAQLLTRAAGRALSIPGHATGVVRSGRSRRDEPAAEGSGPRALPFEAPVHVSAAAELAAVKLYGSRRPEPPDRARRQPIVG